MTAMEKKMNLWISGDYLTYVAELHEKASTLRTALLEIAEDTKRKQLPITTAIHEKAIAALKTATLTPAVPFCQQCLEDLPNLPITEEEVTRIFQGCETEPGNITLWSRHAIIARDAIRYCLTARARSAG